MKPSFSRFVVRTVLLACFSFTTSVHAAVDGIWAQIYSPDISTYADNLRAAGVPKATVGVIISHEINTLFRAREAALQPSLKSLQTLKEGWSAERREALIQLRREKNELLRSVLGAVPDETAKVDFSPESLAGATVEQREMARLIMEDYQAMTARVNRESRGFLLEEDREKIRYLDAAVDADLAQVLSPELAVDFHIERTGYLRALRGRLELFKPTAQEVRDLFTVRRRTGLDVEARNMNSNRLMEIHRASLAELAKLWSPKRYAEYTRLASTTYQEAYHLARRRGLPSDVADRIFDSRKETYKKSWDFMQQSRAAQTKGTRPTSSTPPSSPQNDPVKDAIAEHISLVKQLLGEAGYEEYYGLNSSWIDLFSKGSVLNPEGLDRNLPL